MRTLKKTLCLVLAVVMVLGLGAFSVSAKTAFSDDAEIKYQEAVEVLNGINVLEGKTDTEYKPTDVLTRAEGAAITARLMGQSTRAGVSGFSDTADVDSWAGFAISYLYANGIVDGTDDEKNTFEPNAELTGAQFAKMLLGALGYDAEAEGMTGTSWEIGVARMMYDAKLPEGTQSFDFTAPIDRQTAAQLGYNALKAPVQYYEGGVSVNAGEASVKVSGNRDARANTRAGDYRYPSGSADTTLQLAEMAFPSLKLVTTSDDFGAPTDKWQYNGETLSTLNNSPTFVYTQKMSQTSSIKDDLAEYNVTTQAFPIYRNGVQTNAGASALVDITGLTGNGYVVEVYTGTKLVGNTTTPYITRVVQKTYNLFEVTAAGSSVVLKSANTNTYPRVEVNASKDNKNYYDDVKDLAVGDYILLAIKNASDSTIVGTLTPDVVEGNHTATGSRTISGTSYKTYTIGGTAYTAAENVDATSLSSLGTAVEYTAFLEPNGGYLIYAKANNKVEGKLAFLLATHEDGDAVNGYKPVAKLLLEDGTTKNVQVYKIKPTSTPANGALYNLFNFTTETVVSENDNMMSTLFGSSKTGVFVKYTENADGSYNLEDTIRANNLVSTETNHVAGDYATIGAGAGITNSTSQTYELYDNVATGVATFQNNGGTALVVKKTSGYDAWKGVKNFPNVTLTFDGGGSSLVSNYVFAYVENGYAKFVYVDGTVKTTTIAGTGYNYLVFASGTYKDSELVDGKTVYTYEVVYNGVKQDIKSKLSNLATVATVYANPTFDGDNYLTDVGIESTAKLEATGAHAGPGLSLSDGTLTVDNTDGTAGTSWSDSSVGTETRMPTDTNGATDTKSYTVSSDFVCVAIYKDSNGVLTIGYIGLNDANRTCQTLVQTKYNSWTAANGDTLYLTFNENGEVSAAIICDQT